VRPRARPGAAGETGKSVNELVVRHGGQQVSLVPGQAAVIGRGAGSILRVDDPRVSREHLRLSYGSHGWLLESVGRSGTYLGGQPVSQVTLTQPVEVRLAQVDGPLLRFEPAGAPAQAVPVPHAASLPQAAPAPAALQPAQPGQPGQMAQQGQPGQMAQQGQPGQMAQQVPAVQPGYGPPAGQAPYGLAPGQPGYPGQPGHAAYPGQAGYPAPGQPGLPGAGPGAGPGAPLVPGGIPGKGPRPADLAGGNILTALRMLVPIAAWIKDPAFRKWYRVLVAVYALAPVIMLVQLQHTTSLTTLGWVYCLYVAPLWALVFWFLIRPGQLGRRETILTAIFVVAEIILIPTLTLPWENALAPANTSQNPASWTYGVGLAEEFTKALPVLVAAIVLLRRKTKLDVRMWMFLACLSGLMFGVYEASTVYVPLDVQTVAHGFAFGIPEFVERVFLDGLQHALWAGIGGFFIGLGANYHRQRIPLWIFGLALPSVLHGLNDWSTTGVFGHNLWPWIGIQAFSVFLFLGYTASAASIEREVRHTPMFRGDSMIFDASRLAPPPGGPRGPRG
jgi:RsiW-degrading membrane proteinase PrsW (M82 family)